jgi:hypothetical protein
MLIMPAHAFLDNPVDDARGGSNKGKKDKKRQNNCPPYSFCPVCFPAFVIERLIFPKDFGHQI